MTKTKFFSLLSIPLFAFSAPAAAQQEAPAYLSGGIGIYDSFGDDEATDFRLEYRDDTPVIWVAKPYVGGEITSEGSIWAGGGVYGDFFATENVYITPSVGVGLYSQGGSDLDLDYPIEFRSQLEAGYQFFSGRRLSASYSHTSNWGLGDDNPGSNNLNIYLHTPINSLF